MLINVKIFVFHFCFVDLKTHFYAKYSYKRKSNGFKVMQSNKFEQKTIEVTNSNPICSLHHEFLIIIFIILFY